ncbi:hypothetical protein [Kallotenue papyrolyticum]|uniref:hypothetical protein n=1 Tax=Kallotenue papyrolyticum TaxID=1325125 RepID=UPI0004785A6D|nr:hypothetical protein [Kallotenue papyrolyticum]
MPLLEELDAAVERAIDERWHLLSEAELVRRGDALLRSLPALDEPPPTIALLLRRYGAALRQQICPGLRLRFQSAPLEASLRELTSAVLLTMGRAEALSLEAALLIALVLWRRGLEQFCASPATGDGRARL